MSDWWRYRLSKHRGCGVSDERAAVDRVLALAQGPDRSVSAIARAWTRTQGRQLVIEDVELPVGVFGRWLAIPGRDVVQVGVGVVGRERTIAHELGHMVLGHRGQPVTEYAAELVQIAPAELIAHMLQRTCAETDRSEDLSAWPADECAAERFAGLLTRRLEAGRWGTQGWAHHLDDALG